MSIDLAWKSLSDQERARIINYVDDEFIMRHTVQCEICTALTNCGAIQHMIDFLEALEEADAH